MATGIRRWFAPHGTVALATALVVGMFALRLAFLGQLELIPEEAYYWLYSQHLAPGYLDHPPMVGWLIALGTRLFGHGELGVRIGALASWCVAAVFLFRLGCELYDRERAWLAVGLFSILPIFAGVGYTISPDSPLFAAWSAALYFLYRAAIRDQTAAWYWLGCAVGLGMLSKYTVVLIAPIALLVLLLNRGSRHWLFARQPYVAALIALVIFSPVLFWNATHEWASFVFQGPRRMAEPTRFALHRFIIDLLTLVTPTAAVASVVVLQELWRRRRGDDGDPRAATRAIFVGCASLVPILVFGTLSLRHAGKLNWSAPAFLPLLPSLADQIASFRAEGAPRWRALLHASWRPTFAVLAVGYLLVLAYLGPGLPFIGYSAHSRRFLGWESLARQVVAINDQLAAQTGRRAVIVGMDKNDVPSELAFYARTVRPGVGEEVVGRTPFGVEGLMFEFWDRQVPLEGRDVILVARDQAALRHALVEPYFQSMDAPQQLMVTRHGKPVGPYHYRVGRHFTAVTPNAPRRDSQQ